MVKDFTESQFEVSKTMSGEFSATESKRGMEEISARAFKRAMKKVFFFTVREKVFFVWKPRTLNFVFLCL